MRWGLDLAAGLQVVPAERIIATPVEASRPLLLVPLAILRTADDGVPVEPLPGRHGPAGRDPLAVLGRLYRPTTRWAASACPIGPRSAS